MATTAQITGGVFPQEIDLIARNTLAHTLKSIPQVMRTAPFTMESKMASNTGMYKLFKERIHIGEYASYRAEGDVSTQALVQYGYEKAMTLETKSKQVGITEIMRRAGKDSQEINDLIRSMVVNVPNRMDLDICHYSMTFHTATTYVDQDGRTINIAMGDTLAAGSAVHTLTGSATTYSTINTGNPQFSKGSLEAAEKSFVENTYNNLGEKMTLSERRVILTTEDPNTCNSVKELLFATADVTSSNSGTFNVYQKKYQHISSGRIATDAAGNVNTAKAKYWALVAPDASDLYLCVLQEPTLSTPSENNNGADISSGNWTYVVAGIYGIVMVTSRGWRYSTGLGV